MKSANPVIIRDYDPGWPQLFELLRSRVVGVLGDLTDAIEHVGSTSVPGLAAKPIIDIDVLLVSDSDLPVAISRLASIGYEHRGNLGVDGREAFRTPPGDCAHHLYVCPPCSPAYFQHVVFRDYLRTHQQDTHRYAELKRALATKFRDDREAYNEGKSRFVAEILRRAAKDTDRS